MEFSEIETVGGGGGALPFLNIDMGPTDRGPMSWLLQISLFLKQRVTSLFCLNFAQYMCNWRQTSILKLESRRIYLASLRGKRHGCKLILGVWTLKIDTVTQPFQVLATADRALS